MNDFYRITKRSDGPPPCGSESRYLYLLVFPDILKIGITRDLMTRIGQHERARQAPIELAYFGLLETTEARKRESQIAYFFSDDRSNRRGKSAEWFSREHITEALVCMRRPEALDVISELRWKRRMMAEEGHDPHFELKCADELWASMRSAA